MTSSVVSMNQSRGNVFLIDQSRIVGAITCATTSFRIVLLQADGWSPSKNYNKCDSCDGRRSAEFLTRFLATRVMKWFDLIERCEKRLHLRASQQSPSLKDSSVNQIQLNALCCSNKVFVTHSVHKMTPKQKRIER